MMRSFYEKNLLVMGIKVVVGTVIMSEDIVFFFGDLGLTRIGMFVL